MSVAALEMELSAVQRENSRLHGELNTAASGVSMAQNRLENFNQRVCLSLDSSREILERSHDRMVDALQTQAEIKELYTRFKAMELANKRIRDCNNRKFYEFANYTKVRKLVQGIMDNLDVNMASDRVIYKSVERQHLVTPDYWLTCVLLSIMAWRNDDKALADRAMDVALRLDKKSCSIFYMLFNLRMHREDAAIRWFQLYQQCDLKGADQRTFLLLFSLVSKCINSSQELSEPAREEIKSFINRVIQMSVETQGYSREEMVNKIACHLYSFGVDEDPDYPLLRKYSKEYGKFTRAMKEAKANVTILDYLKTIIHIQPEERNAFLKGFIDELIAKANSQEQEVYEEIAYNETIIRMEGDVDKAKEIFGARKVHDEKPMNLVYEMIEWVYGADKDDVNAQSRLNMLVLTKDYQQDAIDQRVAAYRSIDRRHSDVTIGEYSANVDFMDPEGEKKKAREFYEKKRQTALAAIKAWPAYVGFGVGAAAGIASFFTSYALLLVTAFGVGYGAVKLLLNRSSRRQAEQNFQQNCRLIEKDLDALYGEYRDYNKEYLSYDSYAEEIRRELDSI